MNWQSLVGLSILLPMLAGCLALLNLAAWRKVVVVASAIGLSAIALIMYGHGPFNLDPSGSAGGINLNFVIAALDFALLFYILYLGFNFKHRLIIWLTIVQLLFLALVELMHGGSHVAPLFADQFSLMMVLIVSIVGSLIALYALEYMRVHEEHLHLSRSRQGRFFFFMLVFLGAMNGLVLSNNLLWMYFFWEITTLCSFMLIGHDDTEEARTNSRRALWMNLLGGAAFVFGLFVLSLNHLPLEITALLKNAQGSGILFVMALLCIAGFTKSAQVPFQSWLTGAMVAPTPVSALLHSSTMVNAGVYLILRMAPLYHGTLFSSYLAFFGAFTFIATSTLALSQKNGKKILAYSTIANLGMIVACAGIGSPAAIAAGILLILFHAVAKGLLFMCMGYVEQNIGSRMIEDMRGLFGRMPRTTIIMVFGMITMFLPPFGALLSKWMVIEASAHNPMVVIMLALGSAFTVVFWARWAGLILCNSQESIPQSESQPLFISVALLPLAVLGFILSLLVVPIYSTVVAPVVGLYYQKGFYLLSQGGFSSEIGAFSIYPLFFIFILGLVWSLRAVRKDRTCNYVAPYMAGIGTVQEDQYGHKGPLGKFFAFTASNFYLVEYIGEDKLVYGINLVAIGTIIVSLAGVF